MFQLDHPEKNDIFTYYSPKDKFIGCLSIPHSGEDIPPEMIEYLSGNEQAYKQDVDYKVDALIDIEALQSAGIAVIVSHVHRICVDLNRDKSNTIFYWKNNTQGIQLINKEPDEQTKDKWITTYYRPYYEMLKGLIHQLEKNMALASFVDLHSMPSSPTPYHLSINPNQKKTRPDFCISDRKGLTCAPEYIQNVTDGLSQSYGSVSNNDPYVGGFITEYANDFKTNNIQIEINRNIYMDEVKKVLIESKVEKLKPILTKALITLFEKFA